jgi:hypothetical protein
VVRDMFGAVVQGATVNAGNDGRRATTDAQGRFRVEGLPSRDSLEIVVRRLGYLPLVFRAALVPGENIFTFELQQIAQMLEAMRTEVPESGLSGIVGDTAFDIVPGASITSVVHRTGVLSNEKGQFVIDPEAPGADMLLVQRPGFHPRLVSFTMPAKGGLKLVVWLTPIDAQLSGDARRALSEPSISLLQALQDFGQRRRYAPAATTTFATREQFARYAPHMSLLSATRYLPRFQRLGSGDVRCVIVDGHVLMGQGLELFNSDEVETLEIVRVGSLGNNEQRGCAATELEGHTTAYTMLGEPRDTVVPPPVAPGQRAPRRGAPVIMPREATKPGFSKEGSLVAIIVLRR